MTKPHHHRLLVSTIALMGMFKFRKIRVIFVVLCSFIMEWRSLELQLLSCTFEESRLNESEKFNAKHLPSMMLEMKVRLCRFFVTLFF